MSSDARARRVLRGVALLALLLPVALTASGRTGVKAAKRSRNPLPTLTRARGAAETAFRRSPYVGAMTAELEPKGLRLLFEDQADRPAYPASVTKLMTALLVLEDLKAGRFAIDDRVVASPVRSRDDSHYRQPSCVGLKGGESLSVRELLTALMVHSANDAAVFLAEKCSGTVTEFVARMNARAAELGMRDTVYHNPNGLPPPSGSGGKFNVSTARDQMRLAECLLREHPEILDFTSIKVAELALPGKEPIKFVNHNDVMVKDKLKVINPDGSEAVDGLKTGYIDAGGSSVVMTGRRNGHRVIVVVLGSSSRDERNAQAADLMRDALDAVGLRMPGRQGGAER